MQNNLTIGSNLMAQL